MQTDSQPRIWEAKQGDSLKDTLNAWAHQANVKLVWEAGHDYKIGSNVLINGTFGNAVKVLFAHSLEPGNRPKQQLVNQPDGNAMLVIKDQQAAAATSGS